MMAKNKKCGIYRILNTLNKKVYIGSSSNIPKRFSTHKSELKKNKHMNVHLQRSWNIHGESHFKFEVLFNCKDEDKLKKESEEIEKHIKKFGEKNLYNIVKNPYQQAVNYDMKKRIKEGFKICKECCCLFKVTDDEQEVYFDGYTEITELEDFDIKNISDEICLDCSGELSVRISDINRQLLYEELDEHYQEQGLGEYVLAYLDDNIIQDMKRCGSWED